MGGGESLPSGTVTFLFTDVERSTQTVEAIGNEAYADALEMHRQLLREAFKKHGAHEVGTEGDSLFVAFARAHDAVEAAVAGQRALKGQMLRVRIGIHTGEALVRGGEYVGHDVHKAKRISDAGHGGQILVSLSTAELVRDVASLSDLGPHRLKDLAEPERIFQVCGGDLGTEFPRLRSLEAFRTNLPIQRSSFVGRDAEIAEVRKLLENNRLVTLSGVGGCGKTRLALQVGAEEIDRFHDGVFFVELAPIADPALIARAVASAVGLPLGGLGDAAGGDVDKLVLDHLARQRCLLILDNCEHLLDASAEFVDRILGRCPDVTVVVTSREGLDVEGEQSYTVPSLSLPASETDAAESEAVSLFKARAQSASPRFDLTPTNIRDVVEICTRLDGIPLAIELAASRVTHLSPRQIADRLDDLFRELTGGRRRVQRQQTLQATLDWSYELLDDTERALLARLAVFAGGFTLEAVEGICADEVSEMGRVVDLLASLVSKSLVIVEPSEVDVRYRLLEPVRLYAAGKLRERGEGESVRTRHRDWYLGWLESFPREDAAFEPVVVSALERDLDNLRAAMEWSDREDRPDLVARLASYSFGLLFFRGHYEEIHRWLLRAIEVPDRLESGLRADSYASLSFTATMRVEPTNVHYMNQALKMGEIGGLVALASALRVLTAGTRAWTTGRDEDADAARRAVEQALNFSGLTLGWKGFTRAMSSAVELMLGDYDRVCTLSAALIDDVGSRFLSLRVFALSNLAVAAHLAGRDREAFEAASGLIRAVPERRTIELHGGPEWLTVAAALVAMAAGGDTVLARSYLRSAVEYAARYRIPLMLNAMFVYCAAIESIVGRADRATRLLGAARWAGGIDRLPFQFRDANTAVLYRHYVGVVRDKLGIEEAKRGRDEGRAMTPDHAAEYALEGLRD